MIELRRWPPTPIEQVRLLTAKRIKHALNEAELAHEEERSRERDEERAIRRAERLLGERGQ